MTCTPTKCCPDCGKPLKIDLQWAPSGSHFVATCKTKGCTLHDATYDLGEWDDPDKLVGWRKMVALFNQRQIERGY